MNLCLVNEDRPRCNVPRKAIKACPGRGQVLLGSLWPSRPLSHLENGHDVPFFPQDFCSLCEFVHCSHNTWIPPAGIFISSIVNGIIFLIFFSDCSLSVYRNTTDFCVLTLYLAMLMNSFILIGFFLNYYGFIHIRSYHQQTEIILLLP